jgi:hypothetical protein
MKRISPPLDKFRKRREFVSIRRAAVDEHPIQAFIVDFSKELVLLQKVYDFCLDGFLLLRRADLTSVKAGSTEQFQRKLLDADGVTDQVDFDFRAPISSYGSFLASLEPDEIVMLQNEHPDEPEFLIGPVVCVDDCSTSIRFFTGAGEWEETPREIELARITSCEVRSNYIQFYSRHFKRLADARMPQP